MKKRFVRGASSTVEDGKNYRTPPEYQGTHNGEKVEDEGKQKDEEKYGHGK